jgi:hypothetical protein
VACGNNTSSNPELSMDTYLSEHVDSTRIGLVWFFMGVYQKEREPTFCIQW